MSFPKTPALQESLAVEYVVLRTVRGSLHGVKHHETPTKNGASILVRSSIENGNHSLNNSHLDKRTSAKIDRIAHRNLQQIRRNSFAKFSRKVLREKN
jgi:hypothetical protein